MVGNLRNRRGKLRLVIKHDPATELVAKFMVELAQTGVHDYEPPLLAATTIWPPSDDADIANASLIVRGVVSLLRFGFCQRTLVAHFPISSAIAHAFFA
jgi:hypothetical protein